MTMEIAYYTCVNNDCPKHRNVFTEGDPLHANCERERLFLEGQSRAPGWLMWVIPAIFAVTAGAAVLYMLRRNASKEQAPPPIGERDLQTWSGTEQMNVEREGHAVPPPMA